MAVTRPKRESANPSRNTSPIRSSFHGFERYGRGHPDARGATKFSFSFRPKTGEPFWGEVIGKPVVANGKVVAINGIVRDVPERKDAEDLLRRSEEQNRLLVENALSAIAVHKIVLDQAGKPIDYVFLQANAAFERQTGLRVEDVIGRRITEVLPGIGSAPFIEIFGKVVITGQSVSFEHYAEPLGRYLSINAYRVAEGQFAAIFIDITENRRSRLYRRARGDCGRSPMRRRMRS